MSDLEAADIERLLHEGARRRGMTVEAYRNLVQATTDDAAGVSFEKALQVVAAFERMRPGERKVLLEQLAILEEEAAGHGVSVGRFVRRIMLADDEGGCKSPSPARSSLGALAVRLSRDRDHPCGSGEREPRKVLPFRHSS